MVEWREKALNALRDSLEPVPTELNTLDWKSGLSPKTERLAQHISAFANLQGGGLFVFGVNNDGTLVSISQIESDNIVQLLGNIAQNNLVYPIHIEHAIMEYESNSLLFVYIPEQVDKPVFLKGKDIFSSYCRSAGQTVKMSRNQIKDLIANAQGLSFEKRIALDNVNASDVLKYLNYQKFFELLDRNIPKSNDDILKIMEEYHLCKSRKNIWQITNIGAILFSNAITAFPELKNRSVIVRKYIGTNNREMEFERQGQLGYAVGFEGLVNFIVNNSQKKEVIDTIRKLKFIYPKISIREFVANALVHQDFTITGIPILVEIFSNRLSITNPGAPLNDVNRLIDLPPNSRNELLAQTMFLLGICERRGSGIDRAIEAIEKQGLPPVKFTKSEQHTCIFLYPSRKLSEMTKEEKIRACYQHACLLYEDHKAINNQSIRERFGIDKNNASIASRIITDTLEAQFIKLSDPDSASRKYATYIPYYG